MLKLPVMPATDPMLTIEPPSGFPDQWSAGLDASQSASDVDLKNLVPFVDLEIGEPHKGVAANNVHKNMQRSRLRFDLRKGSVPLILSYHIQFYEVRLATGFIDLRRQGGAPLLAPARDEHSLSQIVGQTHDPCRRNHQ